MNIKTTWIFDTKQAEREVNKLAKANFRLEDRIRKLTGKSLTATQVEQRLGKIRVTSSQQATAAARSLESQRSRLQRQLQRATSAQRELGSASRRTFQDMDQGSATATGALGNIKTAMIGIATGLVGASGIRQAVTLVNRTYETWLETVREISAEVKSAHDEVLAFAALQEEGTKGERAKEAMDLGARFGVGRGEAWETVQAMQSMLGDYQKGLKAAETIFAGKQTGIPVELGKELEILGISQKQEPGEFLRMAFAAGEASGRTPEAMAKAAAGMKWFDDKEFGFAVASALAGSFPEQQLPTYLRRAGAALSDISPLAQAKEGEESLFEQLGLEKSATQMERLEALAKAGINTTVKLKEAGLTELRQIEALAAAVPLIKEIKRTEAEIEEKAKPGLLTKKRVAIEEEMPWMATQRRIDTLESMFKGEQALGPGADPANLVKERHQQWGLALKNLGREQALWFKLQDEEGRTTEKGLAQAVVGELVTPAARAATESPLVAGLQGLALGMAPWLKTITRVPSPGAGIKEFQQEVETVKQEVAATDPRLRLPPGQVAPGQAPEPLQPFPSAAQPSPGQQAPVTNVVDQNITGHRDDQRGQFDRLSKAVEDGNRATEALTDEIRQDRDARNPTPETVPLESPAPPVPW